MTVIAGQPTEFRFSPDELFVQSGDRIGVILQNEGDLPHEFAVPGLGFHLHADPGEEVSGAFLAGAPAQHTVGCYIPGHFESGMKGTLEVT